MASPSEVVLRWNQLERLNSGRAARNRNTLTTATQDSLVRSSASIWDHPDCEDVASDDRAKSGWESTDSSRY